MDFVTIEAEFEAELVSFFKPYFDNEFPALLCGLFLLTIQRYHPRRDMRRPRKTAIFFCLVFCLAVLQEQDSIYTNSRNTAYFNDSSALGFPHFTRSV